MNPTSDHVDIAGYLVDMLTPPERRRADAHIRGCADCREEIESMQQWSSKLRDVPDMMLLDGPPEGADLLLQRTLRQVRTETSHRRQRRSSVLVAAAVAVIIAAIGGGVLIGRDTISTRPLAEPSAAVSAPPGTRTMSAASPVTGARMILTVTPAAGWVRVSASVGGIPAGEKCRLEVVGRDGTSILAGGWLVSKSGETGGTMINGTALIDPAQVASVRVVNTSGKEFIGAIL